MTKPTTIRLTAAEETSLLKIAADVGATLRNGKPSWRKLLQQIAIGKFKLTNRYEEA